MKKKFLVNHKHFPVNGLLIISMAVAAEGGGLEGLQPPQLSRKGGRAPPKLYMCVTSSTSREQYCFKQYS